MGVKVREVGRFIREQRHNAKISLRKLSSMAGVSNPYLSQIERGLRRPSAEILQAIAKALKISAETLYVQAGILDERVEEPADVPGAVRRDPALGDRQKQILIELYESFRGETASTEPPARRTSRARSGAGKATRSGGTPGAARAGAARAGTRARSKRAEGSRSGSRSGSSGARAVAARRTGPKKVTTRVVPQQAPPPSGAGGT